MTTENDRKPRISRCAEASRAAEHERIAKLTPLQRMNLALTLGRRQASLVRSIPSADANSVASKKAP